MRRSSEDAPAAPAAKPAALASRDDDPVSAIYDADPTGYLQCSEGNASYLSACVQMSDLYNYFRMKQPTLKRKTTCAELGMGFEYVSRDPIFPGFEMYYVGGEAAFTKENGAWLAAHPQLSQLLGAIRETNPACRLP